MIPNRPRRTVPESPTAMNVLPPRAIPFKFKVARVSENAEERFPPSRNRITSPRLPTATRRDRPILLYPTPVGTTNHPRRLCDGRVAGTNPWKKLDVNGVSLMALSASSLANSCPLGNFWEHATNTCWHIACHRWRARNRRFSLSARQRVGLWGSSIQLLEVWVGNSATPCWRARSGAA